MKNYIKSTPITEKIKVKTLPDAIVLFCFQYGYTKKYIANKISMPYQTFSDKLRMNKFTVMEYISIKEFINRILKDNYGGK